MSLRSQDGKRITNSPNAAAKNSGAISERSFSEKNCKEFEVIIIQRFRESGTISVRKGQGRKTILDARDLQAFRWHCITYRNATVMEITTWAQEYFQKTLSVNPIHQSIRRCRLKLYRSKKKPYLNMIQERRRFLWAKAHLKWTVAKWKTVLWSDESKCVLFGKLGRHIIRTKEDKDNPSCYQRSVQKPASLMVWGCMSACGMGSLHIWKGTINAERYIQVLEQHMLPSRRRLFQGRPCIFQHNNARPHTASITTSWLRRRRIRVLKWPACSPDLSPIENIWRIIKRKMRQRRPKTVEQLEACIRQEWHNIPIPKLEQLVSSVPRRLQTVIKRRGDATQW